jgi:uncharacterized protein YbaR (Trm112 family)
MNWIDIKDQKPEEDRELFYFFEVLGVYRGKYEQSEYPPELFEEGTEPVYGNSFYGSHGFLTDDVSHWMYVDGHVEGYLPPVPDGYIKIGGRFNGYALESETMIIRKDEYEFLKSQIKYLDAGHLNGLVCPECPHFHIYWNEDDNGYKCPGCGAVHNTKEVEKYSYRYESKYERPCPNCNPHKENTPEFYRNGFLEHVKGNELYSGEHYICNKCDSTYTIDGYEQAKLLKNEEFLDGLIESHK